MKAALALACTLAAACGGDDGAPVCPTGNCTLPGSTIVKWKFNHFPALGFDSDTCSDLGVVSVRVEATNAADPTTPSVMEKACGEGQLTFLGLSPGHYDLRVTPLDASGNALVTAPATGSIEAAMPGMVVDTEVDVNYPAWMKSYTGQLLFRLKWGGMSCPDDVTTQLLTLTVGGAPRTESVSIDGSVYQKLDGTQPRDCVPFTQPFPMNVMGLPTGFAKLAVVGKDTTGAVTFEHTFDTFIGAGMFNPTLVYDLPAPDPVDPPVDPDPVDPGE